MMDISKIAAIILAGGYSSRMGKFKPLLPLKDSKVIEKVINTFKEAGVSNIKVVVGYKKEEIIKALDNYDVDIVYNPLFKDGMFTSIRAGVESLENEVSAFFLLPVDIPLVRVSTIKDMLNSYEKKQVGILYPSLEGSKGHPPLINTKYNDDILNWSGEGGLRALLRQYPKDSKRIEVADEGILLDMDTELAYERVLKFEQGQHIPTPKECMGLLASKYVPKKVIRHCQKVARFAQSIALSLKAKNFDVDVDLVLASALVHDISKGQSNHAEKGAILLKERGFKEVAEIVASHMDIDKYEGENLLEAEIVYFSDKLTKEDRTVSLDIRFKVAREKFKDDEIVLKEVERKFKNAQKIEEKLGKIIDFNDLKK